jgi:hypothetical protein
MNMKINNKEKRLLIQLALLLVLFWFVPKNNTLESNGEKNSTTDSPQIQTEFLPDTKYLDYNVTEFNQTAVHNPNNEDKYGIIYQYGEFETAAFYSVSGDSNLNSSFRQTTGFNFTLPAPYYQYWNLSYVNYFNTTHVVRETDTEYYVPTNQGQYPINYERILGPSASNVLSVQTKYRNVTAIKVHFTDVVLYPGDNLRIYNASYNINKPVMSFAFENQTILRNNFTIWIDTKSAIIELNTSSAPGTRNYKIDAINWTGQTFTTVGYEEYLLQVNPEIVSFRVSLAGLNLTTGSVFVISDPLGNNITKFDFTNYTWVAANVTAFGEWTPNY